MSTGNGFEEAVDKFMEQLFVNDSILLDNEEEKLLRIFGRWLDEQINNAYIGGKSVAYDIEFTEDGKMVFVPTE